jgi:hypothetical protein
MLCNRNLVEGHRLRERIVRVSENKVASSSPSKEYVPCGRLRAKWAKEVRISAVERDEIRNAVTHECDSAR